MRILFISGEPIRKRQASATHIGEIVNGLKSAGHEVTICVTRVMGSYDRTSLLRRCAAYFLFWFQVLKRLHQVELVYARAHPANIPISLAARLMRIPVVHEINGSYDDISITHAWLSPFKGPIAALYRIQYRMASALIPVTPGLADWVHRQAPAVPLYIVPNGANCEIFHPARPPVRLAPKGHALFFGSLTRWHGIETMLAAVEDDAWPADIDLVILGDGQLKVMTQDAASRNPKIHALASVSQETLAGYITGATVGLVPLNSVGGRGRFGVSPLKLYEMLACGLPVVVTDFPGQAELVRSLDAGSVVPPNDPTALARAVAALYDNTPSRDQMMKVAAIIKAEHSWGNRAAETEKVLTGVLARVR